jgi:hypothetical protein
MVSRSQAAIFYRVISVEILDRLTLLSELLLWIAGIDA